MKKYVVEIEVPSGSRPVKFLDWLQKLLASHRMNVVSVKDEDGLQVWLNELNPPAENGG